ncbi:hypothetical protein J1G44_17315 [Cellulomonas sp. zg-ZUI199]|uniref:Uncharacterized protein n=1 Tax=Cellulomonas wangleii TaxID=2816956 RepID=A0ABX8D5K5_9CELL|nr:hypothetical protein [Cellulomonas wangleii]MBO0926237.1 hypothetical protein [Cellulomonas wangleii]QVI62743.1 hypothetical protein KG103_02030 [Cellulomonas wangleii]
MPDCFYTDTAGNHHIVTVSSCQECYRMGGSCMDDGGGPPPIGPGTVTFCFIRNVLTRSLANLLTDVGSSAAISRSALALIDTDDEVIPPARGHVRRAGGGPRDDDALVPLTGDLRSQVAARVTDSILRLATTYRDTVAFRDDVLMPTTRGRRLRDHYDVNLPHLYAAAARDLGLVRRTAATWLSIHPFVAAVVAAARGLDEDGDVELTPEQVAACKQVFRDFHDASSDEEFRHLLDDLEREFEGYAGLTPRAALERLRDAAPPDEAEILS